MTEPHGIDDFLNPYTFIPAYPRETLPEPLCDSIPPGRDRLNPGRWTGTLKVELTVRTPLLLLDTARADKDDQDHATYPVLTRDGRPHLPTTSVKGMLRAAYEAITNSRFGVFDVDDGPHTRRLGWRRGADDAQGMKPVRVSKVDREADWAEVLCCESALLPAYGDDPVTYEDKSLPEHGQVVRARLAKKLVKPKGGKPFLGPWIVRSIVPYTHDRKDPPETPQWEDREQRIVTGVVCATGRNAVGKRYERLFFPWDESQLVRVRVDGACSQWSELVGDYREAHSDRELHEREKNGRRYTAGEHIEEEIGMLAWSRHLWDDDLLELKPGALCYAEMAGRKVLRLYPVLIPRDVTGRPPAEMLPESLRPARHFDRLSLADRVFGWVAPKGSGARPAAYRGRLRIGPVTCGLPAEQAVTGFEPDGLPLAILGQPKPVQGRFYLAESPDQPDKPLADGIPKQEVHSPDRGLRGRKVYWHHAAVSGSGSYWKEPRSGGLDPTQEQVRGLKGVRREFRRPRAVENEKDPRTSHDRRAFYTRGEQRDNQNRSIRGWVDPGTTFSFTIGVQDLDETELGALLWLLSLPEGHFHRLGLGKPLGFGSVRLDLDGEKSELFTGEQWAEYYRALSQPLPASGITELRTKCVEAFDALLDQHEGLQKAKAAFLAAASGVPELPVHYPRARTEKIAADAPMPPDPRGRNYSWFTANEKTKNRRVLQGRGLSLPSAESRRPLRVHPEEK